MAPCRCVVSFTDSDGILHEVEVYASSVYEAVGEAVQEFRTDAITEADPGAMTEFTVLVHKRPVTHKLRLKQVTRWAEGSGKSPQELLQRERLRRLLKLEPAE